MSFEKLKEYALYIVLSLIGIGALVIAYMSVSNSNKGTKFVSEVVNEQMRTIGLNQKIKDSSTISKVMFKKFHGKQFGGYTLYLHKGIIFASGVPGDTFYATQDTSNGINIGGTLGYIYGFNGLDKRITMFYMPAKSTYYTYTPSRVNGRMNVFSGDKIFNRIGGGLFDANSSIPGSGFENTTETERGFFYNGYIGFGPFKLKSEAEYFRDTFFNKAVVGKDPAFYVVFFKMTDF